MAIHLIVITVAILTYVLPSVSLYKCEKTEKCILYENPNNCEYQCPIDNFDLVVHVEPGKKVTVDCYNFTLETLPEINTGNVEEVHIRRCPLPTHGFSEIVNPLGVIQTKTLKFGHSKIENLTLTSEYFSGLHNLRILSLPDNHLQDLSEDVFKLTPNLVNIDFMRNKVHLLPNIFQYTLNLNVLDLSMNSLVSLPKGIFINLRKLQKLHLWGNKLELLKPDMFVSTTNLSSLELSYNHLKYLPEEIFSSLKNLTELNLSTNELQTLPQLLFSNNHMLRSIKLNRNSKIAIPEGLFVSCPNLELVEMCSCKLDSLPEKLFSNSNGVRVIDLHENNFETLPKHIFKGLTKLNKLYLNSNQLNTLPELIFDSLIELESLYLQDNRLTTVDRLFGSLKNLKLLNLEGNEITVISNWAFDYTTRLIEINMSRNRITFEQNQFGLSPLNKCSELKIIDLSHNYIVEIPQDLFLTKLQLENLDLSFNNITSVQVEILQKTSNIPLHVNLMNNQITEVDLKLAEIIAQNQPGLDIYSINSYSTVVELQNNPIACDCHAYDLTRYIRGFMDPRVMTLIQLNTDNLKCVSPPEFESFMVNNLFPRMLTCLLEDVADNYTSCPKECTCHWRPWDKALVFECNGRNLTQVPQLILPDIFYYNQTEVHLENNMLIDAPKRSDEGYNNASRLFISHNQIKNLDWIPPNIEVMQLHDNNLTRLSNKVLTLLKESRIDNLTLSGNPWKCDCDAANFSDFLRQHLKKVDPNSIKCTSGKLLVHLNKNDLCKTYTETVLIVSTVSAAVFFIFAILAALYYRYQQEIKVWLFAHDMFLWWVTEEEVDKDKLYDAFLSFSHKDEDFVTENLLPVLERGPQPYKICIHLRNWTPGEFIAEQIVKSVEQSRRTIVVLSPSFLESVWGKMEFRTAHQQALNEKRARVIVILYGDVNLDSDLDDELKAYIKTNTYVKWGDPWFWNKMKYALPHSQKRVQLDVNSQKHANIMIKLDDKFSLMHTPATPTAGTTPPAAITLDPMLLKDHPLSFTPSNKMTPPAESGSNPLLLTENT